MADTSSISSKLRAAASVVSSAITVSIKKTLGSFFETRVELLTPSETSPRKQSESRWPSFSWFGGSASKKGDSTPITVSVVDKNDDEIKPVSKVFMSTEYTVNGASKVEHARSDAAKALGIIEL